MHVYSRRICSWRRNSSQCVENEILTSLFATSVLNWFNEYVTSAGVFYLLVSCSIEKSDKAGLTSALQASACRALACPFSFLLARLCIAFNQQSWSQSYHYNSVCWCRIQREKERERAKGGRERAQGEVHQLKLSILFFCSRVTSIIHVCTNEQSLSLSFSLCFFLNCLLNYELKGILPAQLIKLPVQVSLQNVCLCVFVTWSLSAHVP